jgi:WD40 repeat protein
VRRDIPRDLVTIVQKSIAREPGRRYASAELLASDLQRFLDDEPIQARRQTNLERAVRWARHNPGIAVLGGVLTAVLVLATVVSLLAAGYFNQLRHEEADAAQQARNARNDALTSRHASQVQSAELLLDRGLSLAEQGEAAVGLHWMLESLNVAPDDAVDLRRVILTNLGTWSEQVHGLWRILPLPPKQVGAVAFSPDGKTFVTGTDDGLQLRNADTFERIGKPFGRQNEVFAAVFSPDGKTLLTAYNGAAQRWDVATGAAVGEPFAHRGIVRGVAFSPDGEVIATASEDRTARLWDAAAGKPMQPPLQHDMAVLSVAFSPDGKSLLTSVGPAYLEPESTQGAAYIWDVATGKQLGPTFVQQRGVLDAAFSPDDLEILTGGVDRTARLWDRATAAPKNLPSASHPTARRSSRAATTHSGLTCGTDSRDNGRARRCGTAKPSFASRRVPTARWF